MKLVDHVSHETETDEKGMFQSQVSKPFGHHEESWSGRDCWVSCSATGVARRGGLNERAREDLD